MTTEAFEGWVILELMGHRRLGGFLREQEIAGASFIRIDVPAMNGQAAATQFYTPAAIYCITPTTEEMALAVAQNYRPEPVSRWDLRVIEGPKPAPLATGDPFHGEYDPDRFDSLTDEDEESEREALPFG